MAESSSGKFNLFAFLLTICFRVLVVHSIDQNESLFVIGGLTSIELSEKPLALVSQSICTSLPNLPQKRKAGFMDLINGSLIFCGGRSDNGFQINADCWRLNWNSTMWEKSTPLPRSLSGATAVEHDNKLWVFGGVVEEDYYQSGIFEDLLEDIDYYHNSQPGHDDYHDYYDYVIDETSNDVLVYDISTDQWTSENLMPIPLQGSCAIQHNGKILLLGGKNEKISGSRQVLQFDPSGSSWSYVWPDMVFEHYNHGCTLFEMNGHPALAVGGGQRCDRESSEIVEFLILPTNEDEKKAKGYAFDGIIKWNQLPNTNYPHAYVPAMGYVNGFLYIVGGGDIGSVSNEDKIERYQNGKWWSFGKMPVRAYGSRIQLPSDWIQGCSLEPNLGIHEYHQTRTQDKLKGTKWLCFNDELLFADQDEKSKIIDGGCTVPGCHYPKIFHRNVGKLRNKSLISCQLQDLGLPSHHVECSLKCRQGWSPSNGINSTICNQEIGGGGIQQKKLTNFTVDYLECSRLL